MKAKYIKTMDFEFDDVEILNCDTEYELAERIKESEVIKIDNEGTIEYINSAYIMFYELKDEEIKRWNLKIKILKKNLWIG